MASQWTSYITERNLAICSESIEHNRYRIKNGQQLYNEGKELKAIEVERARQRQGQRTDIPNIKENFPESDRGQARDIVAQTIGLGSGKQWDKLAYVHQHKPSLLPQIKPESRCPGSIPGTYIIAWAEVIAHAGQ